MKKILLVGVITCIFYLGYSQGHVPIGGVTTRPGNTKDTTGKGNRPTGTTIAEMSNTITIPTGITPNQGNNVTNNGSTTVITTNSNNQNLTLEELNKKVASLEAIVNSINNKLPFQAMAAMTIEATDKNMEMVSGDFNYYKHQIRIDNPISNNNPKAVIFGMYYGESKEMQIVNAFYNAGDGYWYLSVPQYTLTGFRAVDFKIIERKNEFKGEYYYDVETNYVQRNSFDQLYGVATVKPHWPKVGDKYSVLIFKELPNYNPGIYQRPAGQ